MNQNTHISIAIRIRSADEKYLLRDAIWFSDAIKDSDTNKEHNSKKYFEIG